MLVDRFGRHMDYLRLAVTDRCNLRCRYCMPSEGIPFVNRKELLDYDELLRLTRILSENGVKKIRLTGGEPFVRKDLHVLIKELFTQFESVHITTNATRIHEHMDLLAHPRMKGLNISIDSLDRQNFARITRRDEYPRVMENILLAKRAGIEVKLNVVVMRGMNEHEIPAFLDFGAREDITVRFIEAMPFNASDGNRDLFLSYKEIGKIIEKVRAKVEPIINSKPSAAMSYLCDDHQVVDIIPAYSRLLCGSCNRVRLTPRGRLLTCLYAKYGLDLKQLMREQKLDDAQILQSIQDAISMKKETGHEEERSRNEDVFQSMTSIGG